MVSSIELLVVAVIILISVILYYFQKLYGSTSTDVHIVVDNSNIFIVRLNVDKLADLIESKKISRHIQTRIVGGSEPPKNARVWKEWENRGYTVLLGERTFSNKEEFLDDMLHSQVFRLILSHPSKRTRRQVLVLLSGDGNSNYGRTSFPETVRTALQHSWNVELWSWKNSFSKKFSQIQNDYPSQMTINYFDSIRNELTFTESTKKKAT
ncbi:unnamed protein product [Adineta ricciae]|uniref:Uncharacterized protein n=1 Tax=Adineta ricciae TaxID=249248 RepID=A0A814FT08_ADIRI|nr:unnamed protein product [Adineta ricciae]CAF1265380.1 unnamed protein product [Adineta ricciae]